MLISFIPGIAYARILALSLVLWDPQVPIGWIHDIDLHRNVNIHCHHLPSAWRTTLTSVTTGIKSTYLVQ